MCLKLSPLSFDDNKVLKMSIGYANICSSVQDHRQKVKCLYSSIGFGRTNESNEILQNKSLCCKIESEEDRV